MSRERILKKKFTKLLIFNKQAFFISNVMLYYHIWLHMQCWGASSENCSFTDF